MSRVIPEKQHRWFHKIVNNLGSVLAMVIVLSILGYALMVPSSWSSAEHPTFFSPISKSYSSLYGQAKQHLGAEFKKLQQAVNSGAAMDSEKIVVLTLVSLLILVALDGFVVRKVLRSRA